MGEPLWTWDALVEASGGRLNGAPSAPPSGVAIDSRALKPGDVFVALTDVRDGHQFVPAAFAAGASGALVSSSYARGDVTGALLRVEEPLGALERIGAAARARLSPEARVIAITGSVGKTGTKDMLRACLARLGATHAAEKSFNNHWGVPLTLARMPADTRFAVFEIGMNHAGEITPLTRLVRPHVAVITAVEPVHLGFFSSVEDIADAKAEILYGMEPGGAAILNRDNAHFGRLADAARTRLEVISFGRDPKADVRLAKLELAPSRSVLGVDVGGRRVRYALGTPGAHTAANSVAVVAALHAIGADIEAAIGALEAVQPSQGRGTRRTLAAPGGHILLIDESYNANPASMRAALAALALVPRSEFPRRIAVLGDMLELGTRARALHAGLKEAVDEAGVDLVFAAGPNMAALFELLPNSRRGGWADGSMGLAPAVLESVAAGDAVMIKGSLGSRMAPLVEALAQKYPAVTTENEDA